jgi:hypothetical protein
MNRARSAGVATLLPLASAGCAAHKDAQAEKGHVDDDRLYLSIYPGPDESSTDGPFSHIVRTFLTPHLRAARQKAGEDHGWTAFTENPT